MNIKFPNKFDKLQALRDQILNKCQKCNHTGYINNIQCECFKEFERYVEYEYSGIETEYWKFTFDDFKSDQVAKEQVVTYCQHLDNANKHGLGIIFHGENGRGKSMLACLILMEAIKSKYTTYFITFSELLELIKKSFKDESSKILYESKIKNVDFLCLDNLGSEYRPKDLESFCITELDRLFRYRRRNHLCTVITTNLSDKQFISTYGKTINSLISGSSKFIYVNGEDWRIKQSENWDVILTTNE